MRRLSLFVLAAATLFAPAAPAEETGAVPARRAALAEGLDLPGNDLRTILDVPFEACLAACLDDRTCTAFTYNGRSSSCFPKAKAGEAAPYQGALSGRIYDTDPAVLAAAPARAAELSFLRPEDLAAARDQAASLSANARPGDASAEDLIAAGTAAASAGDLGAAIAATGSALVLTDAADLWLDYARDWLARPATEDMDDQATGSRAAAAAVNAYLRADAPALRASILATLAGALERAGRGRDMIPALRLAQSLQPRDDAAAALAEAIGKYGFRIEDTQVESDLAAPRICASFTEDLHKAGTDYATFVKLPETGLSVEASDRRLCIGGLEHGKRYELTFRAGLPAEDGETLAKDVTVTQYVRDRSADVRFPGRAYVLPRVGAEGIPVVTVNTGTIDLTLLRLSDRNLVGAMQTDYFGRQLDQWSAEQLQANMAETVWTGTGETAMELNRDMTTLLPLKEVMADLGPGIYALMAAVPKVDLYDHPAATQWFTISDLGLTTLDGVDGLHVMARALSDASPVEGATATLISRGNSVIATAQTDAAGQATFGAGLTAGTAAAAPALVTLAKGDDIAFLSLSEPEFDLSDRGVAGHPAAPPIDVFLAADRGAYRAGETVHATVLARDSAMAAIEGLPVTARLVRPDGVEYARALLAPAGAGGFTVALPLGGTAPRGTWQLEAFIEDGKPLATANLLVEDFLPERIDVALSLPGGALRLSAAPPIMVEARYLFGAPGAGLDVEGDVRIAALDSLEAFPGYVFGRYDDPFTPYRSALDEVATTDDTGAASLPITLPDLGEAAMRPLEATVTVRVREGSGRPVERQIARRILPEAPVIGIRPDFSDATVPQGSEAGFQVIAVGPDEKPAARKVHWTLNRVETEYQWYALYGNWSWEETTSRSRVASGDLDLTGDAPLKIAAPVEWGEYELVVEAADSPYTATSMRFSAGWYLPGDTAQTPDTLTVALDQKAYRPGDTAKLRVESQADGIALVSVLTNRVIASETVPVKAGANVIDVPVTEDWGAGAYVTASVIRPLQAEAGRAPARALGLAYAPVDPGARKLDATFETAAEAAPRGPLPVTLKVAGAAPGDQVFATIAAVDAGILNLTGYTPPDPEDHYFGQRRLGVGIRDIYGRLIDGRNGAPGAVRSGGDAAVGLRMKAPPPTEELMAQFSGPLTVGEDGAIHTSFDLPAFNGTVRLMAVVWSKTAIGQASTDVLVRDPVVVTATLPRFLAPGDESRLMLELVHATGPAGHMKLSVTSGGVTLGPVPEGADLAEKGKAVLTVPVTAPAAEGDATIEVTLTTPDGKELVKTLTLPVRANDPEIVRQSRFDLAAGASFTFDGAVFDGLLPGSGHATLAAGPIARLDAPGLLALLDAYPYGCTEQLTSQAMPLLYFEDVARAMDAGGTGDIHARVEEAISAILLNQAANGAFGLWDAESGDLWLDAYVTDFLSRAKARGYSVPGTAFRNALDNLRNQVNYAPDFDADGGPYAYALMVLAREGAAAVGDLRYYADTRAAAFDTPIAAAQLGAALALYGDQRRADAMFAAGQRLIAPEAAVWRADYGSALRDSAALLALAAEAGSSAVDANALAAGVARDMAGRRLSTQEASWTLLAARALLGKDGAPTLSVDGAPVDGPFVRVLDGEAAVPQAITNSSGSDTVLTLTTFGVPQTSEPEGGKGYSIRRSYYTPEGEAVDIAAVKAGTRLVAVIEITPHGDGEARLMVDDPLPAGFEIDNPSLIRAGDIAALGWLETAETRMTEFRQDRFLAALDRAGDAPLRLAYMLRAISPGTFRHPAASVEDMYRPDDRAWTAAGRVTVTE